MKKKFAFYSSVIVASSLLAACGDKDTSSESSSSSSSSASESESSSTATAKKQELHLLETAEIPSLDSAKSTDTVSFTVLNNIMEGLYRLDKDSNPIDGIAEVAKTEKNGSTYTFHLRDAKWSNGDPVTAHDFVYAWRRLVDPATASEYAFIMFDVKNAQEVNTGKLPVDQLGVTAVDDKTFKVELVNDIPYFPKLITFLSFFPQNEKYVKSQGDKYGLEYGNLIFNGPFVLSDWKHEQGWTYAKNPAYWDTAAVKLDKIDVKISKDTAQAVNLYKTGSTDRVQLTAEFVDQFKEDPAYTTFTDPRVFFVRMNTENALFKNKEARQAVSKAFDKEGFVSSILNNGSIALNGLVPFDYSFGPDGKDFRKQNGDLSSYNVEEAKTLWDKAKAALGKDKFEVKLLCDDTDTTTKIAEYLKGQLETNLPGISITITKQPFKQRIDLESKMDYDFSISAWGPDYPDPMTFMDMFVTDGAYNRAHWSNLEYDKYIQDSKTTLLSDVNKRWEALLTTEKILMEEAPIAPLYQRGRAFLQQPYVKGIVTSTFGAEYTYKWAYIE